LSETSKEYKIKEKKYLNIYRVKVKKERACSVVRTREDKITNNVQVHSDIQRM
jgi:hypothetical protein